MKKIRYIFRELSYLIRQHKLYFITPLLLLLGGLALLFFHLGPGVVIAFIYAGV